jgi:hypothetical protein
VGAGGLDATHLTFDSASNTLFGIDPASGKLTATDASLFIPRPVAVTFYARRKLRP